MPPADAPTGARVAITPDALVTTTGTASRDGGRPAGRHAVRGATRDYATTLREFS